MASFNNVTMIGNLTRDVEIKYTASGTTIGTFGLASNRRFKQNDELKEEVCFVDIVVFGKQAENAAQYVRKGSQVLISGRLQQRRWETEDGQKRSKHEVVAESIVFLNSKKSDDSAQEEGS